MSIIIAKVEDDKCIIYSDTKISIDVGDDSITGDGKLRFSPDQGVLKTHILHQKICVAFAGNVEISTKIIKELCISEPIGTSKILKFLKEGLIKNEDDSQFLVSLVIESKNPKLYKVSKDNIEEGNSFWIGDHRAFSEFQKYFLNNKSTDSIIDKSRKAFHDTIRYTEINSIGDFMISACYEPKYRSFIYQENTEAVGGFKVLTLKANTTTTLSEGLTEDGAYVVSNLISDNILKPCVCIFFSKGNIAYLYFPISNKNDRVKPIKINCTDIKDLKEKVFEIFKINLIGLTINLGNFKYHK